MSTTILRIPSDIGELLRLSMAHIGLQPIHDGVDALIYDLEYEAGPTLSVILMCVSQDRWFRRPRHVIRVRFVEYHEQSRETATHLVHTLMYPTDPNDIRFAVELGSCVRAGAWALAETLGAGECTSLGAHPTTSSELQN